MIQKIPHLWKKYRRSALITSVICTGLLISSDTVYFEAVEVRDPITSIEVSNACSPSKNISLGDTWILGHSYHCLGYPHIVSTINRVGVLSVDKLVSRAIVLNYVWLLNQTGELSCHDSVVKIDPYTIDKDKSGSVLFAAYILSCNEIQ